MSLSQDTTLKLLGAAFGGLFIGSATVFIHNRLQQSKQNKTCPITGKKSQKSQVERIGCVELGGTSIRLAIGIKTTSAHGVISCEIVEGSLKSIETTNPETNIQQIQEYFTNQVIDRVGIASFGPISLDKTSESYGFITSTPKKGWENYPLLNQVGKAIPHRKIHEIGFDTDVNAAASAEFNSGAHQAKQSLAYITVGTGVGVGLIVGGKCVHGLTHPEGGHILVKPHPKDNFKGVCKFHGTCVEGLVSNHALAERLQKSINELPSVDDSDEVWDQVAYYLAQLCLNLTLISSPEVIVIGGGIMKRNNLLNLIQTNFISLLNQYVKHPRLSTNIDQYIVKPFYSDSGLIGSMVV